MDAPPVLYQFVVVCVSHEVPFAPVQFRLAAPPAITSVTWVELVPRVYDVRPIISVSPISIFVPPVKRLPDSVSWAGVLLW